MLIVYDTEPSSSIFKIINTYRFFMSCPSYDYYDYYLQTIYSYDQYQTLNVQTFNQQYLPSILRVQCTKYDCIDIVMPPEEEPKRRQGVVIVRKGFLRVCMV